MKPLFLLVGRSGSGKTSVLNALLAKGYKGTKSYTTRPRRENEGDTYFFVSDEEFEALPDKIAPTCFNGNKYCITREQLSDVDIHVVDCDGVRVLKESYKERPVIAICLEVDRLTLISRMRKRGDSELAIMERLEHDAEAFKDLEDIADCIVWAHMPLDEVVASVEHFMQYRKENMSSFKPSLASLDLVDFAENFMKSTLRATIASSREKTAPNNSYGNFVVQISLSKLDGEPIYKDERFDSLNEAKQYVLDYIKTPEGDYANDISIYEGDTLLCSSEVDLQAFHQFIGFKKGEDKNGNNPE